MAFLKTLKSPRPSRSYRALPGIVGISKTCSDVTGTLRTPGSNLGCAGSSSNPGCLSFCLLVSQQHWTELMVHDAHLLAESLGLAIQASHVSLKGIACRSDTSVGTLLRLQLRQRGLSLFLLGSQAAGEVIQADIVFSR